MGTQKVAFDIRRNVGHPWDDRSGFDLLQIQATTELALMEAAEAARQKFWQHWIIGVDEKTSMPTAIMGMMSTHPCLRKAQDYYPPMGQISFICARTKESDT